MAAYSCHGTKVVDVWDFGAGKNSLCRLRFRLQTIADNLSKAGWSWGYVLAIDSNWRTIFVADAHRDDGQRFIVRADEKLTAFLELDAAIQGAVFRLDELARFFQNSTLLSDLNQAEDSSPARFFVSFRTRNSKSAIQRGKEQRKEEP